MGPGSTEVTASPLQVRSPDSGPARRSTPPGSGGRPSGSTSTPPRGWSSSTPSRAGATCCRSRSNAAESPPWSQEIEEEARIRRAAAGIKPLGIAAVLAQDPTHRPKELKKSPAPFVHATPRPKRCAGSSGRRTPRSWPSTGTPPRSSAREGRTLRSSRPVASRPQCPWAYRSRRSSSAPLSRKPRAAGFPRGAPRNCAVPSACGVSGAAVWRGAGLRQGTEQPPGHANWRRTLRPA